MKRLELLAILLVLVGTAGCFQAGISGPLPEGKDVTQAQGPETPFPPVVGPTGDFLPTVLPSTSRSLQVADSGSAVARSEHFTTLVTIDWASGGVSSGTNTKSVPQHLSAGFQKANAGGKP